MNVKNMAVTGLLFCLTCNSLQADWPMIRGPQGNGHASKSGLLSRTGDVKLQVRWKKPLGSGYSSVVVADGFAVTGFCDEETGYVGCFRADTGEAVWRFPTGPKYTGANGSYDGPVATPAIAFNTVYALTPRGDFLALDLNTGRKKWSVNLPEKHNVQPHFYGFGSSPVIYDDYVLLTVGMPLGTVCAFDPNSGELAWAWGTDGVAYQNPVPTALAGRSVLLTASNTQYAVLDGKTGTPLLEREHNGQGGRGAWSMIPVPLANGRVFMAHNDTSSMAVDLQVDGSGRLLAETVWDERSIRNSYNVPVVIDNNLYAFSSRILTGVNAAGKTLWRSRGVKDGFLSVVDNHLVTQTKAGQLHVGKADADGYTDLAQTTVFDDTTWSIPAIDGDAIYVRSLSEIARVDIVPGEPQPPKFAKTDEVGPVFGKFLQRVAGSADGQQIVDETFARLKSTPYIEGDVVHFLLRGPYRDAAVASDLFGARQERRMTHVEGTDLFYFAAKVPTDTRASYVFIADYQTITDPRNPRTIKSSLLAEDIEMQFLVGGETLEMSWFEMPNRSKRFEPTGQEELAGRLNTDAVTSSAMNSENIKLSVYTPPGYGESDREYPVVFVHDGAYAITSGCLPQIVDRLIGEKSIPPAVVVFIHRPFHPLMGAPGYEQMFGQELIPKIEQTYRISKDRRYRSSLGGGFGGLLAVNAGLANRTAIGQIGIHTIHAFDMHMPMIDAAQASPGPPTSVFIHWGKFAMTNPDENWDMAVTSKRVAGRLEEGGHNVTAKVYNDGSDWICWRNHAQEMFSFLLKPSRSSTASATGSIR